MNAWSLLSAILYILGACAMWEYTAGNEMAGLMERTLGVPTYGWTLRFAVCLIWPMFGFSILKSILTGEYHREEWEDDD